ncbi:MAG: aspartate--tRNA ligase [Oscillospiraceae bacterium]|nr:aspartate--tRNA ligase [Oscillospiraceae bacterium]
MFVKNIYRTHTCGELNEENINETVKLSGWIDTIRDHGGVLFIDLRDHYGVTQIVLSDDSLIAGTGKETVISIEGKVIKRDEETVNKKIKTGEIEVSVEKLNILSKSISNLPFEINNSTETREEVRLKYRFLDLRNKKVHDNIVTRSKIISYLRKKMEEIGFMEIQTPILTSSSPEGARDYIVPSRKHHGLFYALPQAPQIFKQLLMTSGFDRYFQIAPCFRDEDSRADRSPGEFYQLDFEMAFATQDDVLAVAEKALFDTFTEFSKESGKYVSPPPFVRIPYNESMLKYGTDKPDLRNPLIISDLSEFFKDSDFKPFKNKPVRGIVAPNCAKNPNAFFNDFGDYAKSIGMRAGIGYINIIKNEETKQIEFKGPIAKFLSEEKQKEALELLDLKENDTLFFISDDIKIVNRLAGQIRNELGRRLNLTDENKFEMCFIVDYPMYEINEETGKIDFGHNPFSMPQGGLDALNSQEPLEIKAYQYDIVCNGTELTSGAVRNNIPEIMVKAFEIAGYNEETVKTKFGGIYNAFHYGAPPHAGAAPGVDRIVMLLTGEENLREVIAFPMNSSAQDLLMNAPGPVTEMQLRETHIRVR